MTSQQNARASYLVALIMISTLMGTALISPIYPIYSAQWQLSATQLTLIYIFYMIGALLSMLVLGRLADRWGARRSLVLALILAFVGTGLSQAAQGTGMLNFARFLVGLAAGLVTTGGVIGLQQVLPDKMRPFFTSIVNLIISTGFALGPLTGGMIGQWSPTPLTSVYYPTLLALILCFSLLLWMGRSLKEAAKPMGLGDFLPKLTWPAPPERLRFCLTCCTPFIAFGIFGLYATLMPSMLRDLTGLSGPLLTGMSLGVFLLGTASVQLLARRATPRQAILPGLALTAIGAFSMMANLTLGSPWLFSFAGLCATAGHALSLLGSSAALNQMTDASNRGALTATYWSCGYSGSILPLLLVGQLADIWGMTTAVALFLGATGIMSSLLLITIPLAIRRR